MSANLKDSVREYWEKHPNAAAIAAGRSAQTREFYETIAAHRYKAEPCIRELAEFDRWKGRSILEVGCGIGTDLRQFASAGASVVGIDLTWQGVSMAKTAFALFGLSGSFVVADAENLPFPAETFDLVYSNGVIHHTPDTSAAVHEIHRTVKLGGEARVMVYHRNSYFRRVIVETMFYPLLRLLLWLYPQGRLPNFWRRKLRPGICDMYQILAESGFSKELLFSISTDPSKPGEGNANPLARCYSPAEARTLFSDFKTVRTFIRQLYYADFLPPAIHRWAERRFGWFLFIHASK